uniref:ribonuclease H n=1 Tax=Mastacembelus armatus TaxID=205130 RepID=A0A3Q3M0F2_9TELE
MTGNYIYSIGSSGQTVKEYLTKPLTCVHTLGHIFKHAFMLSPLCPINLLGRDLMIKLGISLISTPEGVQVAANEDLLTTHMVKHSSDSLMYAYEWKLQQSTLSADTIDITHNLVSPENTEFMTVGDLHCTARVSFGSDVTFEKLWDRKSADKLATTFLFWSTNRCALSVSLLDEQERLFSVSNSVPHISLSKSKLEEWRDLGPFVRRCLSVHDSRTVDTDPDVMYSFSMKAYRKSYTSVVHATRTVALVPESHRHTSCHTLMSDAEFALTPALQTVPDTLWAKHKYDVGLIKNCEPVMITPKSTYRPRRRQYPLKKEAIDGITPVFDQAGIIVPCDNSPCCTPIFPVKKIRDADKPTEWRFVQDLQAVNDAVQPRVNNVPNPYTILSQVPSSAQWFSVVDLANAFFSVPVHSDSQFWFAFQFQGKTWTWTRLCQGYCESPTIFNEALKRSLESLVLSPDSALLQYVD